MLEGHSDQELVALALRAFGDMPGIDVAAQLGQNVSQPDISRWRNGKWKKLLSAKRRFLRDFVGVWRELGEPVGRDGVADVARRMGIGESDRLRTLKRWLTHPQILPANMPLDERFRIGEAVLEVDGFSKFERQQFNEWRDAIYEGAHAESGTKLSRRR